jgi:ECF transporter S component (folate family)
MRKTRMIVFIGLLIALDIVLTRLLSFTTPPVGPFSGIRIGFAFVPVVVSAILFGPWIAVLVATLSDVAGFLLLPMNGPLSPLITICQGLVAMIFGLFLYRRKLSLLRISLAVAVQAALVSIPLMALALAFNDVLISTDRDFFGILTHLGDAAYMAPVLETAKAQFPAYLAVKIPARLIQNAVMVPVQIFLVFLIRYAVSPLRKIVGPDQPKPSN